MVTAWEMQKGQTRRGWRVWKRVDDDGQYVWQVTRDDAPPSGPGGYFSLDALMKLRGDYVRSAPMIGD